MMITLGTQFSVTIISELLEQNLGWAAWKLHEAVVNHTEKVVRDWVDTWLHSPIVFQPARVFDPYSVMMGSSPRFNMYGNEFGMGKAVALCSGYANKFDGKVSSYPGYEGGGSIDLELKHVLKENLHYCVTRCKVALARFLSRFFTEACVYLPFPFTACFLEDMIV